MSKIVSKTVDPAQQNVAIGLGTTVDTIERLIAGHATAETEFRKLVVRPRGGANNPEGANQHSQPDGVVKDDIIIFDQTPSAQEEPPKPQQGTSRAYTLDRLAREAPEEYAAVERGEKSANAAALRLPYPPALSRRAFNASSSSVESKFATGRFSTAAISRSSARVSSLTLTLSVWSFFGFFAVAMTANVSFARKCSHHISADD